jgi:hypothetical protein
LGKRKLHFPNIDFSYDEDDEYQDNDDFDDDDDIHSGSWKLA